MRTRVYVPLLALALQQAEAACAAGAKAFPSSHKGRGTVSYGNLFNVTYRDTYKVVQYSPMLANAAKYSRYHMSTALQGKAIPPFILHQCGTTKPSLVEAGVDSPDARFFEIPVQTAALGWEGPLPWFQLLGLTEHVGLIDLRRVRSPCGQLLEHCEPGIHMEFLNASWASRANATDVAFTDSFGRGWAGPEKDVPMLTRQDAGGSLHRAEWLRFVAAFFNEEARADEVFAKIEKDYRTLQAVGEKLSAWEGSEWRGKRPRVLFVSWISYSETFNIVDHSREFVQDAGGSLVAMPAKAPEGCRFREDPYISEWLECKKPNGTASFQALLREADVIFDETPLPSIDGKADFEATFGVTQADVPALARERVFRMDGTLAWRHRDGTLGDLFFETEHTEPQQFLAGTMQALWSKDFQSACGTKYVRRQTGEQRVMNLSSCAHFDAAGSHRCKALHESFQEVPQCSPAPAPPASSEVSAGIGVHLASLALTAVLAPLAYVDINGWSSARDAV